jgi:hypothetical protein
LLHVERVHPERDAALKVSHVGVDGAAVPDVVGGVWVRGAEDALSHEQGLHAHLVGVADDVFELLQVLDLERVLVRGDGGGDHDLGHDQFAFAISVIKDTVFSAIHGYGSYVFNPNLDRL